MRYAIILLLIAAGLTIGGTLLSQHEGYVEIGIASGVYKMQLWYFIAALLVFIVLAVIAIKLLWSVIRIPASLKKFGKNRRAEKSSSLLQQGLLAMGRGQWKHAEKTLAKGARASYKSKGDPSMFLTMAAEAAQRQGAEARRDQYLLEAQQLAADGVNTLAASLTEATMHLDAGEPEKAIKLIEKHTGQQRHNAKLQSIAREAYGQLDQHEKVWTLLSSYKKHAPSKQAFQKEQIAVAKDLFNSPNSSLDHVERVWSELPKAAKKEDSLQLAYVSALIYRGEEERAEKVLAASIKQNFSDPLIHAYTQLESGSKTIRLNNLKNWLRYHPDNAYINYGAAKLAFESEQLDDAKSYAETSIKSLALPEAFALLGKIYEAQGESQAALNAYKGSIKLTYSDNDDVAEGELLLPAKETTALPDQSAA